MAKRTKGNKASLNGVPIYYKDTYNYVDIAAIIVDSYLNSLEALGDAREVFDASDIDMVGFGAYLESEFEPAALEGFMATQFGKGLLFGAYAEHLRYVSYKQELEVLSDDTNGANDL